MDLYLQKESKWKNTNKKDIALCDRYKGRVCVKEEESISVVKRREERYISLWRNNWERGTLDF